MSKFSKACLDAAQAVVDKKGKQWTAGIACGEWVGPKGDGKNTAQYGRNGKTGTVCHSFMLRYEGYGKEPFIFVNVMNSDKMLKADVDNGNCERFIRFMCAEGPFRNFILNGDKMDELMNGGVMIDALAAGNHVTMFIAKTLRILYEDKFRVGHWNKLVALGVHPMLALNVAMTVMENFRMGGAQSHNGTMVPSIEKDLPCLFVDHLPMLTEWKGGDDNKECTAKVFSPNATNNTIYGANSGYVNWPTTHAIPISTRGGREVKVADGWGGYTTKTVGGTVEDIAKDLIALQEKYV